MPGNVGTQEIVASQTARSRFATAVARGTGLSFQTVAAWVLAENGPDGNPLNIGPGKDYGSPEAAAKATVDLLNTPKYASVIATAQHTNDPRVELAAIAESPWDTGKVGPKPSYLKLLLGTLSRVASDPNQIAASDGSGTDKSTAGPSISLPDPVGGVISWIQKEAPVGLAYVVLALLGLAFVIFGALDTFGYSPARVAGAVARPRIPDPIPY